MYKRILIATDGSELAMKGPLYTEELESLQGRWNRLGLAAPSIVPYGCDEKKRFLLLWKKNAPCSSRFPRKTGMAEKTYWWR